MERVSFAKYSFVIDNANIDDKYDGKEVVLGIRPDYLYYASEQDLPAIDAKIEVAEMVGSETYIYIISGSLKLTAKVPSHNNIKIDQDIEIKIDINKIHLFDKQTEIAIY